MIIHHQTNVAAFAGNHRYWFLPNQIIVYRITASTAPPSGRIMSSLAAGGGLAGKGGIAGDSGGLAG